MGVKLERETRGRKRISLYSRDVDMKLSIVKTEIGW